MDGTGREYAKSEGENQIPDGITYKWNIEKHNKRVRQNQTSNKSQKYDCGIEVKK